MLYCEAAVTKLFKIGRGHEAYLSYQNLKRLNF